jgi:hypothetical protein
MVKADGAWPEVDGCRREGAAQEVSFKTGIIFLQRSHDLATFGEQLRGMVRKAGCMATHRSFDCLQIKSARTASKAR